MNNFIIKDDVLKDSSDEDLINIVDNLRDIIASVQCELSKRGFTNNMLSVDVEALLVDRIAKNAISFGYNKDSFVQKNIEEILHLNIKGTITALITAQGFSEITYNTDHRDLIDFVEFNSDDVSAAFINRDLDIYEAFLSIPKYKIIVDKILKNVYFIKSLVKIEGVDESNIDSMTADVINKICELTGGNNG